MKRISELEVKCPEGIVFKKVDFNQDELDKVVKLNCAPKSKAVVLLDGAPQSEANTEIDWKRIKKFGNTNLEVYAVSKAPFKILFGFGGYDFEERKTGLTTKLGFTGTVTLEVLDFKEVLNSFAGVEELAEDAATSQFRTSVCDLVLSAINAANYGDGLKKAKLGDVEQILGEVKNNDEPDGLKNKFKNYFSQKGLLVKEFSLRVNFPGDFQEKYQEKRDSEADAKELATQMKILKGE